MFSPTASSAITIASIPTCSWKPPRPSDGSTTAASPATASLGHQPIRSVSRWARPSHDGRYSRRRACLATHSSAPTCGPPGPGGISLTYWGCWGSGSLLTARSHLLQLHAAEQPAQPDQHHDDQEPEDDQVGVGGGDVAGDHRFRDADHQAAEHRG